MGDESHRVPLAHGSIGGHRTIETGGGRRFRRQGHDAAAEPGAGEPSADRACGDGLFDENVEFGGGDLEVVSQALVAREEEFAEPMIAVGLGCAKDVAELEHTGVLGDDMAGERIVANLIQARIAQFVHPNAASGGFTRGASSRVGAVGERALHAGVNDENREVVRESHWVDGQGAAVSL